MTKVTGPIECSISHNHFRMQYSKKILKKASRKEKKEYI